MTILAHGRYLDPEGKPATGSVTLTLDPADADRVPPQFTRGVLYSDLDATGYVKFELVDDPTGTGTSRYLVDERVSGLRRVWWAEVSASNTDWDIPNDYPGLGDAVPEASGSSDEPVVAYYPVPGPPGPQGPRGDAGPGGPPGVMGPQGQRGAAGADSTVPGPAGPQGSPGAPGAAGQRGPRGADGQPGAQGVTGPPGAKGADGAPGSPGPKGDMGSQGLTGSPGADGQDGQNGPPGPRGLTGGTGAQGIPGPGIPVGGITGAGLIKRTGVDLDSRWSDRPVLTEGGLGRDSENPNSVLQGSIAMGQHKITDITPLSADPYPGPAWLPQDGVSVELMRQEIDTATDQSALAGKGLVPGVGRAIDVGQGFGTIVGPDTVSVDLAQLPFLPLAGGQMDGPAAHIDMNGAKVRNLPDQTQAATYRANDSAPVWMVAAAAAGLTPLAPAEVVAVANIALTGTPVIDGVQTVAAQRVLLVGQTDPVQNGLWTVSAAAWGRQPDQLTTGSSVLINQGTLYAGSTWVCSIQAQDVPWTPDVDPDFWVQSGNALPFSPGDGLYTVGDVLHVGSGWGISVLPDSLQANTGDLDQRYVDHSEHHPVPPGGQATEALFKTGPADWDVGWSDLRLLPDGGNPGDALIRTVGPYNSRWQVADVTDEVRVQSAEPVDNTWELFADLSTVSGQNSGIYLPLTGSTDPLTQMTGEIVFADDGEGVTFSGGGRIYKVPGGGMALRESSGGQQWRLENNDGSDPRDIVDAHRRVDTGTGLTGGGDLSANRTLAFDQGWGDARYALKSSQPTIRPTETVWIAPSGTAWQNAYIGSRVEANHYSVTMHFCIKRTNGGGGSDDIPFKAGDWNSTYHPNGQYELVIASEGESGAVGPLFLITWMANGEVRVRVLSDNVFSGWDGNTLLRASCTWNRKP